jgi:hypothetical protein
MRGVRAQRTLKASLIFDNGGESYMKEPKEK